MSALLSWLASFPTAVVLQVLGDGAELLQTTFEPVVSFRLNLTVQAGQGVV
jgi:hypothetical protein